MTPEECGSTESGACQRIRAKNREPAISVDRCAVTHKKDSTREPPWRDRGLRPWSCVSQSAKGLARGRSRFKGRGPVSGYLSSRRLRASAPPGHGGQGGL